MTRQRTPAEVLASELARGNIDRLGINYDQVPKYPWWAPVLPSDREWLKESVAARVIAASMQLGREPTQAEKDALAYHHAKAIITSTCYSVPVSLPISYVYFRKSSSTMGFPFWKPKSPINPNKFFNIATGPTAVRYWHICRGLVWLTATLIPVDIFLKSYATTVRTVGEFRDPRLQSYIQAVKRNAPVAQPLKRPVAMPAQGPKSHQQTSERTDQESYAQYQMSTPSQYSGIQSQAPLNSPSIWTGMQKPQPEAGQSALDADSSFIDDASPVSESESQFPQQPAQQGSAWDRIRNAARSGQFQGNSREQQSAWARRREDEQTSRGAKEGTSFTYSSSDQENSYAKEQAQKEFDEMLERERGGESDSQRRQ